MNPPRDDMPHDNPPDQMIVVGSKPQAAYRRQLIQTLQLRDLPHNFCWNHQKNIRRLSLILFL